MERLFYPDWPAGRPGVALLLLRAVIGTAFVFHGWPKVQNIAGFAEALRIPMWLATIAAYNEVVGGILLALGLLTPLAAFFLAVQMLVALFHVHLPAGDPFVGMAGRSFELAAVYLTAMVAFLLAGPGAYSVDARLLRRAGAAPAREPRRRGLA